jgi:hypothetical protein
MTPRRFLSALLAVSALAFGSAAQANPISGGVSLAGNGSPQGSVAWYNSTGVTFMNPWFVVAATGSYASVGVPPTFTPVTFGPTSLSWFNAQSGAVNIAPGVAWSFSSGGSVYTLSGDYITNILRGSAANDSISVTGTGTLTISGNHCGPGNTLACTPTYGVWNYTAGFAGSAQNLSFSASANGVPEPGTLALLGLALAGMALVRIRKQA